MAVAGFELRRQSDGLTYRFVREADGRYKRVDGPHWIVRDHALGWIARDTETGELTGRAWDVPPALQGDIPLAGIWVSRKADKSYVYVLVHVTDEEQAE